MIDIDNNEYFNMFQFPGGEWGVKWKKDWDLDLGLFGGIDILARIQNGNDLVKLLTITDALHRMDEYINVTIPYFPGARQDRVSNSGETLSVKVYADIINAQKYNRVTVVDPHSEVTTALLDKVRVLPVVDILKKIVTEHNYDTILIPDAGATKRMFSYYFPDLEFNKRLSFVQCLKKRDTETGKLSGFKIVDYVKDRANCLIVDDIADGGGTFVGLGNELVVRQPTVGKFGLYTTHGIYSKGIEPLLHSSDNIDGVFDELFTTDSWKRPNTYGVKIFELFP